jgi:hypothetical protein
VLDELSRLSYFLPSEMKTSKSYGHDTKFCLPLKLKTNVGYILNHLEDEYDEDGEPNSGSHWVALYLKEYPNKKIEGIYFDPYGTGLPQD